MSANLQYKLLNLEVTPPADAWNSISNRLDNEFDATDARVGQKIYNWEATPPSHSWDTIQAALGTVELAPAQKPAKVVRLPFYKVAAAAVVLGIVSMVTWNFLKGADAAGVVQNTEVTTTPAAQLPAAIEDIAVQPSMPTADASAITVRRQAIDIASRIARNSALAVNYAMHEISDPIKDIHCPQLKGLTAENTVVTRKGISGPLIKDASGKIIMDEGLITTRDNCYIIVTAPNGEQTRISAKFLPLLNYLNASEGSDHLFRDNSQWNSRFTEWRAKLLQQSSFIPGASNFLDIMELRDILEQQ